MAADIKITRWFQALQAVVLKAHTVIPRARAEELQANVDSWRLIAQWIEKHLLQEAPLRSAFDAGCGTGMATAFLKEMDPTIRVVCYDLNAPSLQLTAGCTLLPGDLHKLSTSMQPALRPEATGPFDAVLLLDVLPYLFAPQVVLGCLKSLLSSTGVLYVSMPDAEQQGRVYKFGTGLSEIMALAESSSEGQDVVWNYTRTEASGLFESCGFVVRRFGYSSVSLPGGLSRHLNFALTR